MKAKIIVVVIAGIFTLAACTEVTSDEFCSNPQAKCPDNSAIEASSCCTNEGCYWVYNGAKYTCDGENCDNTINEIIASACISKNSIIDANETDYKVLKAQLQAVTAQLLIEAREASGCAN